MRRARYNSSSLVGEECFFNHLLILLLYRHFIHISLSYIPRLLSSLLSFEFRGWGVRVRGVMGLWGYACTTVLLPQGKFGKTNGRKSTYDKAVCCKFGKISLYGGN